jgi:thiamine biosynthesis lipoprotein ApbE
MKKFLEKHFVTIVFVILIFTFFRGCGDSREMSSIKKEMKELKEFNQNRTYTKEELDLRLKIEGLKSEHRMIQATDRKMFDLNRQTQIEKELESLESQLIK